jgi:hypothetical protein
MFIIQFIIFSFLPNKTFNLAFQSFGVERTWWRLFQKRAMRTKFDTYYFIYKLNTVKKKNWIQYQSDSNSMFAASLLFKYRDILTTSCMDSDLKPSNQRWDYHLKFEYNCFRLVNIFKCQRWMKSYMKWS